MIHDDSLLSIIVPIYNVEHYLQKCIDSIREQTYQKLEIILVDDGSPDDCSRICDINAEIDSRIIVIHKKNEGLSSARNTGLDIAKGEYVSFIDADDTIHPQFAEILVGLCKQYECDIAQCDFLQVRDNSFKLPLNTLQTIEFYNNRQALYRLCCTNASARFVVAWNKVYKKKLFQDIRYPLGKIHEDEFITYLVLWKAKKVAATNQYMYYYLQRKTSITGSTFSDKRLDCLEAYYERLEFLKNKQLWEEYEGTLLAIIGFIKSSCILLKENDPESIDTCDRLLEEKEKIEKILDELILEKEKRIQNDIYSKQLKIALYGAGHYGRICYQWIKEKQYGTVVVWVDNFWNTIKGTDYPVKPVDALVCIEFDYVIVAIKDRLIREEVAENLMSWGISREKIICSMDGTAIKGSRKSEKLLK